MASRASLAAAPASYWSGAAHMDQAIEFLTRHGYAVVFGWVLAEQLGLPIPAVPILLGAGALAGMARLDPGVVLALAVLASLLSDAVWYALGRLRGGRVLGFLCRVSLEPDSCVRRTEEVFGRHGARALLIAKFVPGLSTAAPPLAGIIGMPVGRFLVFSAAGGLLWAGLFVGLGYAFSDQLERVAAAAGRLGAGLVVGLAVALGAYVTWKFIARRRFLRRLRIARIEPAELKTRLDDGEAVVIVDLRHPLDFETEPSIIPGALHLTTDELEARHGEIPRDREIVLYCT
jgi:membrane protein DedA with SNARE-associated domain